MKLKIQRPSQYIRYTDAELSAEDKFDHQLFKSFCNLYPNMILRGADPAWGPSFEA